MNLIWLIGFFYLSVEAANANNHLKMDDKRKWCGPHLADAMELICRGSYNGLFKNTKKDLRFEDFDGDYVYDQPEEISWPFLPQNTAAALIGRQRIHRRSRRGIIEECCHNPCSVKELSNYCEWANN